MPESPPILIPADVLATWMRLQEETRTESRGVREQLVTLTGRLDAHAKAEEPLFAAHADYLQRLAADDNEAAARGVAVGRDAQAQAQASAAKLAQANTDAETARVERRAAANRFLTQVIGAIAALLASGAIGAGIMRGITPTTSISTTSIETHAPADAPTGGEDGH